MARQKIVSTAVDTEQPSGSTSGAKVMQRLSSRAAKAELEAQAAAQAAKSIQLSTIAKAAAGVWVAFMAVTVKVLHLMSLELVWGALLGLLWGLGLVLLYQLNRKRKAERGQLLALIPGAKGMQALLHHIPTWISFRDTEKMEWLNRILEKAWPYYDSAICKAIKEQVEPLMMKFKPPGLIKKIYFQKLTFGDDPFRVEGVRVDEKKRDEICIEVDYRWSGDANIFLAIELPAGGQATRMVPKVSNLAVSGTLRVILRPLLPEIPGFGAAVVSLRAPPIVRFSLDFGKSMGGGYTAGAIKAWLDPFLRETVSGMLLWPRRMVVPLLDEKLTGPLDDLYLRHMGALQIDVGKATNLPRMDTMGTTDAFLELFTLVDPRKPESVEKTKVVKNTLNPVWNERHWLLVQEPSTQALHIECYDRDYLNAKDLLSLNVFKGAANLVMSKDLVGRCRLHIAEAAQSPGRAIEKVMPLGKGEFSNEDGCGGGFGELTLKLTYWPFELIDFHREATVGAVIVTLFSCSNLPIADLVTSDPFVEFKLGDDSYESPVVMSTLNPSWSHTSFDFFRVPVTESLRVKVWDYDALSGNDLLGSVSIPLTDVQKAPHGDTGKDSSWTLQPTTSGFFGTGISASEAKKVSTIKLRIHRVASKRRAIVSHPQPAHLLPANVHRSLNSRVRTSVQFRNDTRRSVDVVWLAWDGSPHCFYTLPPGTSGLLQTFTAHPWCFRDPTDAQAALVAVPCAVPNPHAEAVVHEPGTQLPVYFPPPVVRRATAAVPAGTGDPNSYNRVSIREAARQPWSTALHLTSCPAFRQQTAALLCCHHRLRHQHLAPQQHQKQQQLCPGSSTAEAAMAAAAARQSAHPEPCTLGDLPQASSSPGLPVQSQYRAKRPASSWVPPVCGAVRGMCCRYHCLYPPAHPPFAPPLPPPSLHPLPSIPLQDLLVLILAAAAPTVPVLRKPPPPFGVRRDELPEVAWQLLFA
ncbi:Synaptotagmin-5 [Chlorella vulgaris]